MPSIYNPTTGTITGASESKWFVPEDRLNPDQKRFLQEFERDFRNNNLHNLWVKGFAGSGKSILLVHVARKILALKPNAKIALIVYTQSLVEMFKKALRELTPPVNIPVMTFYSFMTSSSSYEYILCPKIRTTFFIFPKSMTIGDTLSWHRS